MKKTWQETLNLLQLGLLSKIFDTLWAYPLIISQLTEYLKRQIKVESSFG